LRSYPNNSSGHLAPVLTLTPQEDDQQPARVLVNNSPLIAEVVLKHNDIIRLGMYHAFMYQNPAEVPKPTKRGSSVEVLYGEYKPSYDLSTLGSLIELFNQWTPNMLNIEGNIPFSLVQKRI
jgi:hypothetical protein